MTKAETIFAHELNMIHDKIIKDFVTTCFDKLCPDYFWTCPCSTTGKYHPQVSLGVGGLVRHTKLAVWWGLELMSALGKSPELYDIPPARLHDEIIATLLLHDMIKNGKGLNAQGYPLERGVTGTHGVVLAKAIGFDAPERIFTGIACHMGIWTTEVTFRPSSIVDPTLKAFAQLIHLADYAASRKVDEVYAKLKVVKRCTQCGKELSLSEYGKQATSKDGLTSWCKICKEEYDKNYKQHNKLKIAEQQKGYRETIEGHLRHCFSHMVQRCVNPQCWNYKWYGERGIRCFFNSFVDFFNHVTIDLGFDTYEKIKGLQIDRINNNSHYEKGNIRFVTAKENSNNRRKRHDTNKKTTITTGKNAKIGKSPPCPGVRKTESCQTDSETNSQ